MHDEPQRDKGRAKKRLGSGLLGLGAIAVLLLKGGPVLIGAAASLGGYTLIFGLPFAVGLMALILVHEMGHFIQLRREGIAASAPMFIPFFGAYVKAQELPSVLAEARVALAGPLLGTLVTLILWPLAVLLGSNLLLALCFTGLLINLFNLIPVRPLDGGAAMEAISPRLWLAGIALLLAMALITHHGLGLVILAGLWLLLRSLMLSDPAETREGFAEDRAAIQASLANGELNQEKADKKLRKLAREEDRFEVMAARDYREVTPRQRVVIFAVYTAIAAVCGIGMFFTYVPHSPIGQLI